MAREKRVDAKGRILKDSENQMPDGRYRFRYMDAQGARRSIYSWKLVPTDRAPNKKQGLSLREKERQIERDLEDGIKVFEQNSVTLNDMFDLYMAGKTELKQSTRNNYLYMYKKYVHDGLGKEKIAKIKYSHIKEFYSSLINKLGFKPNSMETIHTILHPTFTLAVRDGYIRLNPTADAMTEIKKSHNWEKTKRHALTEQEQEAFINYVAQSPLYDHWLNLFTVFLGTGCRVGEIIGLRWQDCDFKNQTISINHNLIYRMKNEKCGNCGFYITTPKTKAGVREIPMMNEVKRALLKERAVQLRFGLNKTEIDGYSGFIFTNRTGGVFSPPSINRAIQRICRDYNSEEKANAQKEKREPLLLPHFSAHTLRHTFCTRFCENETNLKVIQDIMGHADISTTMNIYAEATASKKKESFTNLEGKIKIS